MAVGVKWPNGSKDTAETWEELEEGLRKKQWVEYTGQAAFRNELAVRALRWSRTEIETDGNSRDFFYELERAGMLTVIERVPA